MLRARFPHFLWIALLTLSLLVGTAAAQEPQPVADDLLSRLQATAGGDLRISFHSDTGKVRYLAVSPDHAITPPAGLSDGAAPEEAARAFFAEYGSLFGVADATNDLAVLRVQQDDIGRQLVRFQQTHDDIPVLSGELIVQMDAAGNVISANGETSPDITAAPVAAITGADARDRAVQLVAKHYNVAPDVLSASEPALWYYDPALLGAFGPRGATLVWRVEVSARDLHPIRELVLVDATAGFISLNFNQIADAKNRRVYDNNNDPNAGLPGLGPVRIEGQGATGNADVDKAYDYSGDTYDFYWNIHGRDSLDGAGMQLISTVRYCDPAQPCPYQNAFWNGTQMVYGQGFASADDVVGHELTHGVTENESSLFYYMQSGAINEAFSDVWGEFVDLSNGHGNDSPGVRWLLGEDLLIGAIRSMSNPGAYGDPDRMGSVNYFCGAQDNGGVHTNSGVANKAAYLLTDGGSFNGKTVGALGINKNARIWYRVQTSLFTSASDYQDLYDLLQQSCTDQIGTNGITASDCQQVWNAVDATQMNVQPTLCPAPEALLCGGGQQPNFLFQDNLENAGSGRWQSSASVGANTWYYPPTANPFTYPMRYATSGVLHFWGYNGASVADSNIRMTSSVALPAGETAYLHFNHAYAFEGSSTNRYDGGVLEYSTDNGSTWQDTGAFPGSAKVNWYNGTIGSGAGNPLAGRSGFTADSNGYTSSRLNLNSLAGQPVRFRFRIGTDVSVDDWGWFVDDIAIYTCPATATHTIYLPLIMRDHGSSSASFVNGGFEQGTTGWAEYSTHGASIIGQSPPLPVTPHSGTWAAWLGGVFNDTSYIEQRVVVPAARPYVRYYHWIASTDACGWDFARVIVNGSTVAQYDLCATGNTGGWVAHSVNLSAYAGQSIPVRISVTTDNSYNSNLFVDDVSFQATASIASDAGSGGAEGQGSKGAEELKGGGAEGQRAP